MAGTMNGMSPDVVMAVDGRFRLGNKNMRISASANLRVFMGLMSLSMELPN